MPEYLTLVFTGEFMESLERLSSADRRRARHALKDDVQEFPLSIRTI